MLRNSFGDIPGAGRRAIGASTRDERRSMECIDLRGASCAQTNVRAALRRHWRHARAQVDPELWITFPEANGRGAHEQRRQSKRREHRFVEFPGPIEISDADRYVIDHGPSYVGAFDFTSL
jgi:hypothetical protein